MKVCDFLKTRHYATASVHPTETIRRVAKRFRSENAGAIIVSDSGRALDGIVTEHDITSGLAVYGDRLLDLPVSALATTASVSCSMNDSITDVAGVMTERRLYYIPVRDDGRLLDVISIGEVLEERFENRRRVTRSLHSLAMAAH